MYLDHGESLYTKLEVTFFLATYLMPSSIAIHIIVYDIDSFEKDQ